MKEATYISSILISFFGLLFHIACSSDIPDNSNIPEQVPVEFSLDEDTRSVPFSSDRSGEIRIEQNNPDIIVTMREEKMGVSPGISTRTSWSGGSNTVNWSAGDKIGVFMNSTGGGILSNNVLYNIVSGGSPSSSLSPGSSPIYFPYPLSQNVDFYAYYPYSGTVNSTTFSYTLPTDQSTPQALANADLMYAAKVTANGQSRNVPLTFKHAMSMISFQIRTTLGPATLTKASLTGSAVTNTGTLNITTGALNPNTSNTFSPYTTTPQNITLSKPGYVDILINPCSFSGLLNALGGKMQASFSFSGVITVYLSNLGLTLGTVTFAPGTRYLFTITFLSL